MALVSDRHNKESKDGIVPIKGIYKLLGFQGVMVNIIEYIAHTTKDVHHFVLTSIIKQFNGCQNPVNPVSHKWLLSFFAFHDHPHIVAFCQQKITKPLFYLDVLCKSKLVLFKIVFDMLQRYSSRYEHGNVAKGEKPTPFIVACEKGYLDDVKVFINLMKADVNQKGVTSQGYSCGYSGLIMAAYEEQAHVVEYLLKHCTKIHVDQEDNYGSTALHYSAYNSRKNTATIKLLLQYGCNMKKMNQGGQTPLDYANQNVSVIGQSIVYLLKKNLS